MKRRSLLILAALSCVTVVAPVRADDSVRADEKGIEFFETKIRPVLVEHCYSCHSAQAAAKKKLKGELLLDTRDGLHRGGENGPSVVPGSVKESLIINALRHQDYEMPPSGELPSNVVKDFIAWVRMGAPDPRDGEAAPVKLQSPSVEDGGDFWAFQAVVASKPPKVKLSSWPRSDIDRFVLAKLEEHKLSPVADASRLTLVRRIYFDLTGLPPTREELETFLNDTSSAAVESLIDKLLASSHFGERWARHWLDVARYAESNGNVRNQLFPNAWRYRDYVIDALNRGTPYDQFITEQLAGDLMEAGDVEQRNRQLTATGFLALASKPRAKDLAMEVVSDQINVTTKAMMGLTVACARCHDHKFDPVPTEDYYALAGIFASSETLYGGQKDKSLMGGAKGTDLHLLHTDDANAIKNYTDHLAEVASLTKQQKTLNGQIRKLTKNLRAKPNAKSKAKAKSKKRSKSTSTDGQQSEEERRIADMRRELGDLAKQIRKLANNAPARPAAAMGVREGDSVKETPVYVNGERRQGPEIARGFVQVATLSEAPEIPEDQSGRLQLAQWLTGDDHPLTSRVMVNRIWRHLFGRGLVPTMDNFGLNGRPPTHPGLLDYLAKDFVAEGWSVKRTIKTIMLSRTYQLSSDHHEGNYGVDPAGQLLWRHDRRRLDAESIRDAMLVASGQLDRTPGVGSVVTQYGDKLVQDKLTVDTFQESSNRRSIYLPILRNGVPESLNVFDYPDPSLIVGGRSTTTVPAQELYLMNSPFVIEQSKHLARLLLDKDDLSVGARVRLAYSRVFSRPASESEVNAVLHYLDETKKEFEQLKDEDTGPLLAQWASVCQALLVSGEFRFVN